MDAGVTISAATQALQASETQVQQGLRIEFGRRWIGARQASTVATGSVIDTDAGEQDLVSVYAGGRLVAKGLPVTVDGKLAVRIKEIVPEAHD